MRVRLSICTGARAQETVVPPSPPGPTPDALRTWSVEKEKTISTDVEVLSTGLNLSCHAKRQQTRMRSVQMSDDLG